MLNKPWWRLREILARAGIVGTPFAIGACDTGNVAAPSAPDAEPPTYQVSASAATHLVILDMLGVKAGEGLLLALQVKRGVIEAAKAGGTEFSLVMRVSLVNGGNQVGGFSPKVLPLADVKLAARGDRGFVSFSEVLPWDFRDHDGVIMTGKVTATFEVELLQRTGADRHSLGLVKGTTTLVLPTSPTKDDDGGTKG